MQFSEPNRNMDNQEAIQEADKLLHIDYHNVKKAALILRSINHKLRQEILKIIHEERKITVTDIYVKLRLEQSVASQHLAIYARQGLFLHIVRVSVFIISSMMKGLMLLKEQSARL